MSKIFNNVPRTRAAPWLMAGALLTIAGINSVKKEPVKPSVRIETVTGNSMAPTVHSGERVYLIPDQDVEYFREDLIIFNIRSGVTIYGPDYDRLIKRITAIPGDVVYDPRAQREIVLEENNYWVMGDNRENSRDSRHFGPINKSSIEGKVLFAPALKEN